ncbi:MAG: transmembrane 220 family protein [Myxococcota bacterium]
MWFTVLNVVMLPLFVVSVVVQHNDPDPLGWMAIYGAAATCCVVALLGRLPWVVPALVGAVALVWAAILAPGVLGQTSLGEMTAGWHMTNMTQATEEGREMGGLLIEATWMIIQAAVLRRRQRAR